jgi:hypothetical protein
MARSETPILDLTTAPPAVRAGVSARGLLIALPAAIGVVALIPAAMYLKFVLELDVPPWLGEAFSPISTAIAAVFQDGPLVGIISIWGVMFLGIAVHETGHAFRCHRSLMAIARIPRGSLLLEEIRRPLESTPALERNAPSLGHRRPGDCSISFQGAFLCAGRAHHQPGHRSHRRLSERASSISASRHCASLCSLVRRSRAAQPVAPPSPRNGVRWLRRIRRQQKSEKVGGSRSGHQDD